MGKLTISMAMFNSYLTNYQRVFWRFLRDAEMRSHLCLMILACLSQSIRIWCSAIVKARIPDFVQTMYLSTWTTLWYLNIAMEDQTKRGLFCFCFLHICISIYIYIHTVVQSDTFFEWAIFHSYVKSTGRLVDVFATRWYRGTCATLCYAKSLRSQQGWTASLASRLFWHSIR